MAFEGTDRQVAGVDGMAQQIGVAQDANFTPYIVAGVLFVLLALPLISVTDWVTLRAARRQNAGS